MHPEGVRRPFGALALVLGVLAAACGSSGDGEAGSATTIDRRRDAALAERVAFHLYDFPAGWEEIDLTAPGSPDTVAELTQCLGPITATTAEAVKGFKSGAGANAVAGIQVWVMRDEALARAAFEPALEPAFEGCVTERIRGLLGRSLGENSVLTGLTPSRHDVTVPGANGVAVDFVASVGTPSGPLATYPGVAFVQRGRMLSAITLLSNNVATSDLRTTLVANVAGRMTE